MSYKTAEINWSNYCGSSAWEDVAARKIPDVKLESLLTAAKNPDAAVKILALDLLKEPGDASA